MPKATCSIEGCDRPVYGHGWCNMHWQRWRKTGDPLAFLPRHETERGKESRRRKTRAKALAQWEERRGSGGVAEISAKAKAQMLAQWDAKRRAEGLELSYTAQHQRLRKERGRASNHCCVQCGKPAQQWSYVHDTDPAVPANYRPMCMSCHYRYDDIYSHTHDPALHAKRSESAKRMWANRSPEQRAAIEAKRRATRRARGTTCSSSLPRPG